MKKVIRLGVISSLALGLVAVTAGPVAAQDEKPAKKAKAAKPVPKAKPKLTPAFEKEIAQVQKLVTEKNGAEAKAKLAVAEPLAQTPDDKLYVGAMKQSIGNLLNDEALTVQGVSEQLDSGSTLMENAGVLSASLGARARKAGNHAEAIKRITYADSVGAADAGLLIFLADSYLKTDNAAEGMKVGRRAIETERKAGRKPPEDWFQFLRVAAYNRKLVAETNEWSRELAAAYPTPANLHDLAGFYINVAKPGDRPRVDAFRLMRDTKSFTAGSEYTEFADLLIRVKMPGEAAAVLKEGYASGKVNQASQKAKDLMPTDAAVAADRASLTQSEKGARSAASGGPAANNAEAYLGYGDYAKAIDLYRLALSKGGAGLDADETNLRLGIALLMSGQKAEATTTFAKVGGTRAELAKMWSTWAGIRA